VATKEPSFTRSEPTARGVRRALLGTEGLVGGVALGTLAAVIDDAMLEAMEKMDKAVQHTQSQFSTVRTGRATPSLVERITVEYYGAQVPLQQLASISVPEARQLLIKPHDRGTLESIEKAIRDSDLGVSPNNDGISIRLSLPQLTEERRREYVKVVKHMAEDGRIAVRGARRDARKSMEAAEKDGEISADELERAEKELEKVTHEHVEHIDAALGRKEQELLEV
jgi:ribosome recycling factor